MLMLKLTPDGAVERYPYPLGDLLADHPRTSFALPLDPADLVDFGVHAVATVEAPQPDIEHTLTELDPEPIDGVWTQRWALVDAPPELVAERQATAKAALLRAFTAALEQHYDAKACERHYDNRLTCALRAGYAGPFHAEGTAFAVWMDTCNAHAYTVLAQVEAGQRAMPTGPRALIDELPALVWP